MSAPLRVRLPPHTLRMTTAGRMACSARQLVASTDGSHRNVKMAGNWLARCAAKRSASSSAGGLSISRLSRASSRPRAVARPWSLRPPALRRTPLIYDFGSPPPGYQSVAAFREARGHVFPALVEEPAPAPVAGTGHLVGVEDGRPYGTNVSGVDVKTLRLERFLGTSLTVHLDVPLSGGSCRHIFRACRRAPSSPCPGSVTGMADSTSTSTPFTA